MSEVRESGQDVQGKRSPQQPVPTGHYPNKGRQNAFDSYVTVSLCTRQTPETFGGISTD